MYDIQALNIRLQLSKLQKGWKAVKDGRTFFR